jgi:hypothetical protein
MWGGDACVALVALHAPLSWAAQGPPLHVPTAPAPTGTKGLPRRPEKKPTPVNPLPPLRISQLIVLSLHQWFCDLTLCREWCILLSVASIRCQAVSELAQVGLD